MYFFPFFKTFTFLLLNNLSFINYFVHLHWFIISVYWCETYRNAVPNLAKMAKRILSLTTSSSGCERNWSTFEGVRLCYNLYFLVLFNLVHITQQVIKFILVAIFTCRYIQRNKTDLT